MSRPAIIDELQSLAASVAAAGEGAESGDWMKVELALAEVQERTGRLLREISIMESVLGDSGSRVQQSRGADD